jgi:hypothetical protein
MAADEWPWTYEVDLLELHPVRRVKLTFAPDGDVTKLPIGLPADGKTRQTVASGDNLDDKPYGWDFSPVRAQFVRVSGLKPNGPAQKGAQMAVAELAVYG